MSTHVHWDPYCPSAHSPERSNRQSSHSAAAICDPKARHAPIAEAAYLRVARRGFAPGHEREDWLAAEVEVDTGLTVGTLDLDASRATEPLIPSPDGAYATSSSFSSLSSAVLLSRVSSQASMASGSGGCVRWGVLGSPSA